MAYMLKMPAIKFGTPVTLVVSFKANDSSFHSPLRIRIEIAPEDDSVHAGGDHKAS